MTSDWRKTGSGRPSEAQNGATSRLLQGRDFLLEIENRMWRGRVAESIRSYGGEILDSFDAKTPKVVISDHSMAAKLEKEKGEPKVNDRQMKALPALLREAIRRGVKIRTPETFLTNLKAHVLKTKKTCSATTSNSTMRGRPTVQSIQQQPVRNHPVVQPIVQQMPARPSALLRELSRPFLRIDLPGKRPDIRHPDRNSFEPLVSGDDVGHSIFRVSDPGLKVKRAEDFNKYKNKQYVAPPKNFKLDEKDNVCQFCNVPFHGERKEHERTAQHRNTLKNHGMVPTCERIILNARLRMERLAAGEKRKAEVASEKAAMQEASKRATVEYEYGENELRICWDRLVRSEQKTPEKRPESSTRRRQKRIRYSPSEGDSHRNSF